jgi:hypothetical protein
MVSVRRVVVQQEALRDRWSTGRDIGGWAAKLTRRKGKRLRETNMHRRGRGLPFRRGRHTSGAGSPGHVRREPVTKRTSTVYGSAIAAKKRRWRALKPAASAQQSASARFEYRIFEVEHYRGGPVGFIETYVSSCDAADVSSISARRVGRVSRRARRCGPEVSRERSHRHGHRASK